MMAAFLTERERQHQFSLYL